MGNRPDLTQVTILRKHRRASADMAYALLAFAASGLLLAMRVYRVRRARFVRLRELEAKFKHLVNDLDAMDYKEAAEIMKLSHSWVR